MVGGGIGAFIGAVHRRAIALEETADLVAGCFSSRREKIRKPVTFMELQRTDCMLPMKKWQKQRVPEKMELILYRS